MLRRNAPCSPSIAIAISETVRIPMTIPSVVSPERSLLASTALVEMRSPSRNSDRNVMPSPGYGFVAGNEPVPNAQNPPGVACHVFLVGDDDDRVAFL